MNTIKRYEEDSTKIRDDSKGGQRGEREVARAEDREKDLTALVNISRRVVARAKRCRGTI